MSKRIRARVAVRRLVDYRHARGHGQGMLLDLSLQGCRITGTPPFPCGTRLRLQLWLPDQSEPVKIEQAVVRWLSKDQFGVSFQDVPPEARARLEHVFRLLHEPSNKMGRGPTPYDEPKIQTISKPRLRPGGTVL